jgi:hypothetical protein
VAATLLLPPLASAVIAVVTTVVARQYLVRRLDEDLRVASRVIIHESVVGLGAGHDSGARVFGGEAARLVSA